MKSNDKINKRSFLKKSGFLLGGLATVGLGTGAFLWQQGGKNSAVAVEESFEIERTPKEWKALLTENQYLILREEKKPSVHILQTCSKKNAKASIIARDVTWRFTHQTQNMRAAQVGQVFGHQLKMRCAQSQTIRFLPREQRFIAGAAAAILAIFLMMAQSRRVSATVLMAWR